MNVAENSPDLAFDHIGIVVPDIDEGARNMHGLFGALSWTRRFDDAGLGVSVQFARGDGEVVYEMIAPLGDASPVRGALKSRANLLNQIAYRTRSLEQSVARLRGWAVPAGPPAPALAFEGARVQFLMTRLGFLIELVEIDRLVHRFFSAEGDVR
jgi:methylmalonyl-CoA/ethylmalonyl-CoA epimerase